MQSEVQERWLEARERMRRRIDAGLWQDIGISSPERARYVDWILDEIFKDEYVALLRDDWTVWRQDDNGNHFVVQASLTYGQSKSLVKTLEEKGHKQFYWYRPAGSGRDS
jgi:hypothetical protein